MTKQDAHRLLDAAKAGMVAFPNEILEALVATGDIGYRAFPAHVVLPSEVPEQEPA